MRADDGLDGMKRFVCTLAVEPDVDGNRRRLIRREF